MYSHKSVEKPAKSYLGKALRGCPCSKLQGLSPLVSSVSKPQGRGVANGAGEVERGQRMESYPI